MTTDELQQIAARVADLVIDRLGPTQGPPGIPFYPFPSSTVEVAAGGITATSIVDGSLTAAKFGAAALAGQLIKSVQYGTITFASGATTANSGAITPVNIERSILIHLGAQTPASSIGPANESYAPMVPWIFPNTTTGACSQINAGRFFGVDAAGTNIAGSVKWCLVEFQ